MLQDLTVTTIDKVMLSLRSEITGNILLNVNEPVKNPESV